VASTGNEYCETFQKLGVKRKPVCFEFRERAEADKKKHLDALRHATGIFITGGNQMRISAIIGGTDFEPELLAAYRRDTVIFGTSAGAAVMSKLMIAYGRHGATHANGLPNSRRN
jgi:cyanophycinase